MWGFLAVVVMNVYSGGGVGGERGFPTKRGERKKSGNPGEKREDDCYYLNQKREGGHDGSGGSTILKIGFSSTD